MLRYQNSYVNDLSRFLLEISKSIPIALYVWKKVISSGNPRYKPKFTISCRRRIVSLYRSSPTRRLYSRSYILRFNLSIVPGITEFRRKNNAYCGTHKAVGHKTPMSGQANSAQARTTCIFMSTIRSVYARVCVCARRFFFLLDIVPWRAGPRCRTCDIAWLPATVATCNRQYRDGQLQPSQNHTGK